MKRIVTSRIKLHIHCYTFHIIIALYCCNSSLVNSFISTPLQVPPPISHHHRRHHHHHGRTRTIISRVSLKIRNAESSILPMLHRMTVYFESMVDPSTLRFFLVCHPLTNERIHSHCPLRELGCAWDATTALQLFRSETTFDQQQQQDCFRFNRLENAVQKTIEFYSASYEDSASCGSGTGKSLHRGVLQEPPNIAHSALLILTCVGAIRLSLITFHEDKNIVDALTQGILSMQRQDGAFRTHFGSDNVDKGIEFYPGEAMTAIMEAYDVSESIPGILKPETRDKIIPAMMRALEFYQHLYNQGQLDTNFNIWQVSAFARFVCILHNDSAKNEQTALLTIRIASDYVLDLCRDIIASPSWKMLARGRSFYPNLATVEIACGLDAIVQGALVASMILDSVNHHRRNAEEKLLSRNVDNAIEFIHWSLDRVPEDAVAGNGGLGFGGIQVMEQRLDVTGHALAALAKIVASR